MKLMAIVSGATIVLVVSSAESIAARTPGDQSPAAIPYAVAQNSDGASVGDGSTPGYQQNQQDLLNEPGYSIGTGAAVQGAGTYHVAPVTAPRRAVEREAHRRGH
jgi:hypothetical protein